MLFRSTAIEGNSLNEFEVNRVLAGKEVSAPAREIWEVKNYKTALTFISKRSTKAIDFTDVLKIHSRTMKNILPAHQIGVFRKSPVFVVRRSLLATEKLYTAPPFSKVENLVKGLCGWIEKVVRQLLKPSGFMSPIYLHMYYFRSFRPVPFVKLNQ